MLLQTAGKVNEDTASDEVPALPASN